MNRDCGLVISPQLKPNSGGFLLSDIYLNFLRKHFNIKEEFIIPEINNKFKKLIYCLNNNIAAIPADTENRILNIVTEQEDLKWIFLNHSFYGVIIKKIKKLRPDIQVVTLFHNIETVFALDSFKATKNPGSYLFYLFIKSQEKKLVQLSDKIIVLNERDNNALEKVFKKKSDAIIPLAIREDHHIKANGMDGISPFHSDFAVFIGSNFYANIDGLRWFAKNVSPFINYPLIVIGKGMENLKGELEKYPNIIVKGFVEDLSKYYYHSKVVVSPIFKGSGMKTKTAEALMYGKSIIGTNEAFEGFKIDNRIGITCNTAEEFIDAYNSITLPKFNKYSREVYNKYHTISAFEHSLCGLFQFK